MKSIRKFKKNAEAVSPVIATILMVAITVVLAAVLLVMVMNMTEDTPPSSATITATADASNLNVIVDFINPSAPASDIQVRAVNSGNSTVYTLNGTWSGTQVSSGAIFTAEIEDELDKGSTYIIQLVYKPNGAVLGYDSVTIPEEGPEEG